MYGSQARHKVVLGEEKLYFSAKSRLDCGGGFENFGIQCVIIITSFMVEAGLYMNMILPFLNEESRLKAAIFWRVQPAHFAIILGVFNVAKPESSGWLQIMGRVTCSRSAAKGSLPCAFQRCRKLILPLSNPSGKCCGLTNIICRLVKASRILSTAVGVEADDLCSQNNHICFARGMKGQHDNYLSVSVKIPTKAIQFLLLRAPFRRFVTVLVLVAR